MSAGIGRLGELYGLSPATMAGLANVSGTTPVGEGVPPPAPAQDPNELGDSAGGFPGLSGAGALPEQPTKVAASPKEVYGPPEPTIGPPAPPPYDPYTDPNLGGGPASGSAAMTVPAHWQPGSHAVSLQHGMSPEELEPAAYAEDVASGHEIGAANKRLEAAQQRGMADAVYSAAHAQASKIANDRIQQLNQDRDNYVTKETKRLDQMALATQKEVDPDAYWRERGSGSKLAAALMIGLNQFAVLWRGRGTNTAMEIINKGIDDNIHAQQANISNAGRALEQRQNLYARNVAAFGDKERAILATKVQYLDQVAAMADGQKAQAGVAENEAAHEQMLGAIYKERAKAAADFAKLTHTQATEQMNAHFVPQQTVGLGGPSAAKREGNLVTLPDGTSYVMPSEKTANEAIEKVQNLDKLQRRNNEIMQLRLKARKLDPVVNATEFNTLKHQLADLADEKVALLSLALGQGTV
jgi:hypothetical protein